MSVMKQAMATPSRVAAVYHYLLRIEKQEDYRERLEAMLSPASVISGNSRDMVRAVVNECIKMGLAVADDEHELVRLNPELPDEAKSRKKGMSRLPITLADLFFRGNGENDDLALVIAWYLDQDVLSAPADWRAAADAITSQVGGDRFGLTSDVRYHQFDDWACFLGFAWHHGTKRQELTPDPTQHLRWRLADVFGSPGKPMKAKAVAERLAEVCPVMEHGRFRDMVWEQTRAGEDGVLSSATSLAWFRLRDEGRIQVLSTAGDADVVMLREGSVSHRCTGFTWVDGAQA